MPQKTLALDGRHAFNRHTLQAVRDASITLPPKCRYSTAREARDDSRSGNPPINENEPIHPQSCQQAQPDKHPDPPQDGTPTPLGTPEQSRTRKYRARRSGPYRSPRVPSYSAKTTSFLEWRLQQVATKMPSVVKAINILRVLVGERHIRPDVRHYRALILANSDPEHGSADQVRTLLAEMEPNGIPVDSGTLHAALQALAVHPDYILREDIMETLRDRWLSLSPAGWHFVVTGLLRQHQFELALDHIAQMKMKNIPIENWLHSLLVYNLCDIEDFDEVLRLMKSRTSQGIDITLDLWYYVLDAASEAVHYKTARYVWRRMVELGYLRPPYGVCRNVLTTAAREGDVALAVSIFRYLEEIGAPRGLEEHEKMSEAHLVSGNLHSAFEALCTMHTSGIALEGSSTRSILTFMIEAKTTPRAAWDILKQLRSLKYDIPTGCANVVIELCGTKAGHDPSVVDDGVTFYKELYTLCAAGADAATYSSLLNMCRKAHKREEATFILKEMAAFGVLPDDQTFEHVILMCLDGRNFMSAFYYFQDLVKRGGSLSEAGTVQVRNTCSTLSDWFSVQLRYHPLIRGNVVRRYPEEGEQEAKQPGEEMPATRPVTSKPRNTIQKPRRQNLSQEAIRHQRVAMKLRIAERRRQKIARRLRALPVPLRSPIMIPKTPQEQSTRAIQRQQMSRERRIVLNKNRRKRKRTLIAIKKRRGELWIDDAEAEDHAEPKGSTGSMGSPGSTESRDKGN